jgi:hypothetical protein
LLQRRFWRAPEAIEVFHSPRLLPADAPPAPVHGMLPAPHPVPGCRIFRVGARVPGTQRMHTSMSTSTNERGAGRHMSARGASDDHAGAFARRIDCDGDRVSAQPHPARGGGLREPEAWERRREPRR